jgi:tetratricopeptide (TPR) repeat protein
MKSQRRHELEQNELADWLAQNIAAIRPYQNMFLGIVVLLALGGMCYAWWSRQASSQVVQASDLLYSAVGSGNPAALVDVATKFPNTDVAQFANVAAADLLLDNGCNTLFSNKATARERLRKAIELYTAVLKQSPAAMIAERATFGRGRAREALGELGEARGDYDNVVKTWPEGTFAAAAATRLRDIDRPAIKEMYDKFAKFDPKPDFSSEPGTPGKRPEFNADTLPEEGPVFDAPKLKLKGTETESPSATAPSSSSEPSASQPTPPAAGAPGATPAAPESPKGKSE